MPWQDRIDAATSHAEVMSIVRDYVATLTPGDVSRLPPGCRPGKFSGPDDVTSFALALVRHDCVVDGATARLVLQLSKFFSKASFRLAELGDT